MDATQTHLASCYAHSGPILDTGCQYRPTIYITRPKMCLGSFKMCHITTRHILDEQMGKWAAREKQEAGKAFELPATRTLDWILGLPAGT